ncbi:unnamed protein product [Danaus chrysippus]|uniref:(African queen) hypothetical protein n=1 Tax=Danaus chrysippus TaxID=151541 RepID=A0A8J2QQL6_9NEOP|nr:unnamed protein product [Danaus chrysippus]
MVFNSVLFNHTVFVVACRPQCECCNAMSGDVLAQRPVQSEVVICIRSERGVRVGSRRGSSLDSPAALLATFDNTTLQIRDWLSVEADMLRAQPVAVGDLDDIISQLDKQKGVLRELEQKKPQLDELLHTAESLKGTENRQQLHGKVTAASPPQPGPRSNTRTLEVVRLPVNGTWQTINLKVTSTNVEGSCVARRYGLRRVGEIRDA